MSLWSEQRLIGLLNQAINFMIVACLNLETKRLAMVFGVWLICAGRAVSCHSFTHHWGNGQPPSPHQQSRCLEAF